MATKKAAKPTKSVKVAKLAKATKSDKTLLSLPVNRTLNNALREARYIDCKPKYPLFDADFFDVWLIGKTPARLMKRAPANIPLASDVAADTEFVKSLASALRGVVESSDIDVAYSPFAVYAKGEKKSDYFGLLTTGGLEYGLVRNLAEGEDFKLKDVSRQKLAFATFDSDEDPSDYYDAKELKALATATEMLKVHCGKVYRLTLSEGKGGKRAVPTYPVFYFGISALGNVTGVFTMRSDT